ncbi:MAG: iron-containing alcohol dehydrogenase [Pseudomonadales bacterium]|nr:iron-containing alcohol dehydrogenase [Pseudomonadales bacterium]MBO6594663.1 iron-containing alcohol dehydrogenase [Pseudomonadales bacterium]MBO6821778.1 iron-containing alcohol dehydrogenase [Pseudomonadales bacterium]
MANLTFLNNTVFDHGASAQLGDVLAAHGIKRPLMCTDQGLVKLGMARDIAGKLSNDITLSIFDDTPENPTQSTVEKAVERYQADGCDGIVALGGGSSMDLAKAVALAVTHEGDLIDYTAGLGGVEKISKVAPLVAIPTTSGTGSEVSSGSVIIMNNGEKLILISPHLRPLTAICDPELTTGLPPSLTAATGMDAVTHCIEALLSPEINPPAEAVGLDGVERAVRDGNLLKAVKDGNDLNARWHMMMAATEGAMAFSKGLGAVHSMSHACGADENLRLHHGTLNAVFLPTILDFNRDHVGDKYARLNRAMGLSEHADPADHIRQLNADLGLPANITEMGVERDQIRHLAEHAAKDVCTFTNPRPCSQSEYETLYEIALG